MEPARQRLRFDDLTRESGTDGRCRVTVKLEWCGRTMEGSVEGLETQHGRVRASAEACMAVATAAAGKRVHLELIGVKAVRAFDGWVVVTRLIADDGSGTTRLLGASSTEDESGVERAACLAVLDATNRILERHVARE